MSEIRKDLEERSRTAMRGHLLRCKESGEPPKLIMEMHTREQVLAKIREWLETGAPKCTDVLWVIAEDDIIDKGIYAWNQVGWDMEIECYMAVVAQAPLMAFIMGEYELAQRWYARYGRENEEEAVELCFSAEASYIESGRYNLETAWMLAPDLGETEGFFDSMCMEPDSKEKLAESLTQFHFQWGNTYDKMIPVERFCKRRQKGDAVSDALPFLVEYILQTGIYMAEKVWNRVFEAFCNREERGMILNLVHDFGADFWRNEGVDITYGRYPNVVCVRKVLEMYGEYEDTISMSTQIGRYLYNCMGEEKSNRVYFDSIESYFKRVLDAGLKFVGEVTEYWKKLMGQVLRHCSIGTIVTCFRTDFLKREMIDCYITESGRRLDKARKSTVIPLLLSQHWQEWQCAEEESQIDECKAKIAQCILNLKSMYPLFAYPLSHIKVMEGDNRAARVEAVYTDGLRIYYIAERVKRIAMQELEYGIMHILLHGMLGHFCRWAMFRDKVIIETVMDAQVLYVMKQIGGAKLLNGRSDRLKSLVKSVFREKNTLLAYDEIMDEKERCIELKVYVNVGHYDDHLRWGWEYAQIKNFWQEMISVVFGRECGFFLEQREKDIVAFEALVFAKIETMRKAV